MSVGPRLLLQDDPGDAVYRAPNSVPGQAGSIFLGLVLKDQLRLELMGARGDNRFPFLEARLDDDSPTRLTAGLNGAEDERTVISRRNACGGSRDEHPCLALDID